ncbi:MAG TPA: class I SAM-dependent methyltransferase [Vicinamibacterales bacterium]|nr:class I SAM-dependent methyltransferase [Vicinamibacterales bacterium]
MQANEHPTCRFFNRAGDYARYRPGYPGAAIDAVLEGLPEACTVADVAAGTGILSRLVAARGARVLAVEPNAAMRAAAAPHPGVVWSDGTAEATGLPDGSVDLVTVAQAFHWLDVAPTLREFARILRPAGRLAIVWNRRSRVHPFTLGYRGVLEAMGAEAPAERSRFDPAVVTGVTFRDLRQQEFVNAQRLTEEQLLGRARSTSTVPLTGPDSERILAMLRDLHARHRGDDGTVEMVYRTELFLWTRAC